VILNVLVYKLRMFQEVVLCSFCGCRPVAGLLFRYVLNIEYFMIYVRLWRDYFALHYNMVAVWFSESVLVAFLFDIYF
jgi:hypothetical protein